MPRSPIWTRDDSGERFCNEISSFSSGRPGRALPGPSPLPLARPFLLRRGDLESPPHGKPRRSPGRRQGAPQPVPPAAGESLTTRPSSSAYKEIEEAPELARLLERPGEEPESLVGEMKSARAVVDPIQKIEQGLRGDRGPGRDGRRGRRGRGPRGHRVGAWSDKARGEARPARVPGHAGGAQRSRAGAYLQISAGAGGHRLVRLGARCCCACTGAGARQKGFDAEQDRASRRSREGGHSSSVDGARLRGPTPSATSRPSPASTGWCASAPSTPRRAGTPPSPRSTSRRRSRTTSDIEHQASRTSRSTPCAPAVRAASTSTRPSPPCA